MLGRKVKLLGSRHAVGRVFLEQSRSTKFFLASGLFLLCLIYFRHVSYVRHVTQETGHKISHLSHSPEFREALSAAELITSKSLFVYMLFVNQGYLHMLQSWICNLKLVDDRVLQNTIIFTDGPLTSDALLSFNEDLNVYTIEHRTYESVEYGTYSYYELTLHRLEIQDAFIQAGLNVMLIEADAVWFSSDVHDELHRLFKEQKYDFISADNSVDSKVFHEFSAGFSGYRGESKVVRELFSLYTIDYAVQLAPFAGRQGFIGNVGEQLYLSKLISTRRGLSVKWLDPCNYSSGAWYSNINDMAYNCPFPLVLQNNYIVGNDQKIHRAKLWGHWFLQRVGRSQTCKPVRMFPTFGLPQPR